MLPISARWIQEFEKHLYRRQHIILYSNIHDQFLWKGTYHDIAGFLDAYFLNQGFDLIVRYNPVDGLTNSELAHLEQPTLVFSQYQLSSRVKIKSLNFQIVRSWSQLRIIQSKKWQR